MKLDPIVSLSVALAEAPKTCAFFLGSGISRDAGVPTGGEVLREGLHRLRQLEADDPSQVTDEELAQWLAEHEATGLGYSEMLELLAPDAAVRREFLAKYFDGPEPGPTHHALADLAVRGVVSIFITTNFDRLLERALRARGIEPVVMASDSDLATGIPREHAGCVVIKPHGDYLQQTIRNTSAELAQLEPGMVSELSEIFRRYGLVVLGYSGSDEGITSVLKVRESRYGLWWVSRSALAEPAAELVRGLGGRNVQRESAEGFLGDLNRKLAVFEQYPTGDTPAAVHDQTLALLRQGDEVGLRELFRLEHHAWEAGVRAAILEVRNASPSDRSVTEATWRSLLPLQERRLAGLLPLVIHDPARLSFEVQRLARTLVQLRNDSSFVAWQELPELAVTWLGYATGALALRGDHLDSVSPLLQQKWTDRHGKTSRLVSLMGSAQGAVGEAMAPAPPQGRRWASPMWKYLTSSLAEMQWLADRYPELTEGEEPGASMAVFDLLVCLRDGFSDRTTLAHFGSDERAAEQFAHRLRGDEMFRKQVAGAVGVGLERFDADAPGIVRSAHGCSGPFSDHERVGSILDGTWP